MRLFYHFQVNLMPFYGSDYCCLCGCVRTAYEKCMLIMPLCLACAHDAAYRDDRPAATSDTPNASKNKLPNAESRCRMNPIHPARLARKAVGLTLAQLAPHGRVSARTLGRYERQGADETAARRLATYLQAEADRRGLGLTIKMDIYLPDLTRLGKKQIPRQDQSAKQE